MVRALILILVASLTLSACGWRDSRLNPTNWFGKSREIQVDTQQAVNPLIPQSAGLGRRPPPADRHVPISKVVDLVIEPTNSGAIIRATGVASLQGAYAAMLERQSGDPEGDVLVDENGVLIYAFEVVYPENPRPVGSEASRRVIVARSLTHEQLEQVRTIRVTAASNARESRRR